jgi:endonuclease G
MKRHLILFAFLLFLFATTRAEEVVYPHPPTGSLSQPSRYAPLREAEAWRASDWDAEAWLDFFGEPRVATGEHVYLIRHKRYVVEYDTDLLNPRWTAHIDTRESAVNSANRPNSLPEWKRPPKFLPDPFLKKLFKDEGVPFVTHDDFTGTHYERGHMTSNAEMKGFDQQSQLESFFLSNIAPQRKDHNGGIWAELEADCLEWAKAFGKVYVVTGPVFSDPVHPSGFTSGKGKMRMAVPDRFFKVLIAEKDGRMIATGFLIDHKNGLKKTDLFKFQVPIDEIEKAAAIDFMPLLGEPNPLESHTEPVWQGVLSSN